MRRALAAACAVWLALAPIAAQTAAAQTPAGSAYVSLKAGSIAARRGPGAGHAVAWIYARPGLPLRVVGAEGAWRRVVDPAGDASWLPADSLEARRTAYVVREANLRRSARQGSPALATLAPGVVGAFTGCAGNWRRIAVGGRVGWVEADALWGADCAGL